MVCQVLTTLGALVVLPSQMNLRVSNSMPWVPTAWAAIMFCMIMCRVVPSRGAILASQLPAWMPPPPGMLRGTMVGSPGIYLPR